MKQCDSQRQAIALARSGRTAIWIRDFRKELKGGETETDTAYRVGYIYSMSRDVLIKLAMILAPEVVDPPTLEQDYRIERDHRGKEKRIPVEGTPLLLKVCDKPLEAAGEFIER